MHQVYLGQLLASRCSDVASFKFDYRRILHLQHHWYFTGFNVNPQKVTKKASDAVHNLHFLVKAHLKYCDHINTASTYSLIALNMKNAYFFFS